MGKAKVNLNEFMDWCDENKAVPRDEAEIVEGENDTLVDASALNETANQDINTESNEAIIQMVVPASTAGFDYRGGRGA